MMNGSPYFSLLRKTPIKSRQNDALLLEKGKFLKNLFNE